MTKSEFLRRLRSLLGRLKREERGRIISYYSELIDDRVDSGATEAQATADLGNIDEIAAGILQDAEEQGNLEPENNTWKTVLLIVGSPLWIMLGFAGIMVAFALYVSIWALVVSAWAVFAAFAVSGVAGIVGGGVYLALNPTSALLMLGAGLICAGLGTAIFMPVLKFNLLIVRQTGSTMKSLFTYIKNKISGGLK